MRQVRWGAVHDTLLFYAKSERYTSGIGCCKHTARRTSPPSTAFKMNGGDTARGSDRSRPNRGGIGKTVEGIRPNGYWPTLGGAHETASGSHGARAARVDVAARNYSTWTIRAIIHWPKKADGTVGTPKSSVTWVRSRRYTDVFTDIFPNQFSSRRTSWLPHAKAGSLAGAHHQGEQQRGRRGARPVLWLRHGRRGGPKTRPEMDRN